MSLPTPRRLLPAAMALLAAAELSVGAIGLATHGVGSHRPAPSAGVHHTGTGGRGPSGAGAAHASGPLRISGAGAGPATGATPAAAGRGTASPTGAAAVASPGGAYAAPAASPNRPTARSKARATPGHSGSPPVSCQTNLALDRSPHSDYDFLCQAGGAPLTWAKSTLVVYAQGLSLVQSAALDVAVGQWESAAGFSVTYTSDSSVADVVITAAPLDSGQPGYTEDGYTTVSYRCAVRCTYYHADVTLSSTASLTSTDWISTVLHELGHVAGLNHVSKVGEVMYPYLTLSSPVLYAAGDSQGLEILAAERGA